MLFRSDGIDIAANYRQDLGFGALALSFNGTWTSRNRFQATPSAVDRDCVGYYSVNCPSIQPKFQFNHTPSTTPRPARS